MFVFGCNILLLHWHRIKFIFYGIRFGNLKLIGDFDIVEKNHFVLEMKLVSI